MHTLFLTELLVYLMVSVDGMTTVSALINSHYSLWRGLKKRLKTASGELNKANMSERSTNLQKVAEALRRVDRF